MRKYQGKWGKVEISEEKWKSVLCVRKCDKMHKIQEKCTKIRIYLIKVREKRGLSKESGNITNTLLMWENTQVSEKKWKYVRKTHFSEKCAKWQGNHK